MSQIVLFHYLPGGRKDGTVYGISLSLQLVGKVLGSSLGMLAFGDMWIGWALVIGAFVSATIFLKMFWPKLTEDFRI
jgi:polyferredoxin